MGYEQAPATQMLATHCVMCNRALVDAESVQVGIGPVCRSKYGYTSEIKLENRKEANQLIHTIAKNQRSKQLNGWIKTIANMGMGVLANSLYISVSDFTIFEENNRLILKAQKINPIFGVNGRIWDRKRKVNTFPITSKLQLFLALKEGLPDGIGYGKKGLFWIQDY